METQSENFFGLHLIIDGYGGVNDLFRDRHKIEEYQKEVTKLCGMKILKGPLSVVAPAVTGKDRGGVSGVVIISESHVAIHTFADRSFVMIDVATCKNDIPVDEIISFTEKFFDFEAIEFQVVRRGKRFFEFNPGLSL